MQQRGASCRCLRQALRHALVGTRQVATAGRGPFRGAASSHNKGPFCSELPPALCGPCSKKPCCAPLSLLNPPPRRGHHAPCRLQRWGEQRVWKNSRPEEGQFPVQLRRPDPPSLGGGGGGVSRAGRHAAAGGAKADGVLVGWEEMQASLGTLKRQQFLKQKTFVWQVERQVSDRVGQRLGEWAGKQVC